MAAQKKIEIIATENISEKLNKAKEALNNITHSASPVKKQLRELQKIMVDMNLDGLSNTDVFTEVAQEAGRLKDAMNDAQQAMAAYANDTFQFKAAAEGFQAVTAAGTIATSTMALFGTENENVKNVLLKVQAAQGVLNGVTAIANVLNKDSALMLKLKQIWMKASTTTQNGLTAATVAGTAAETLATAATKKSTVAQTAWNTAKAIGKAMLGDFTGLILLGAGAFLTYALAAGSSTDKIEENAEKTKEASEQFKVLKSAEETYVSNAGSKFSQLMKAYDELRDSWDKLKTAHEKNQFLKDNKTKIEELTTAVYDIDSAEQFFKDKTGSVVKAFKLRAQAAAAAAVQIDMYKRAMEAEMEQTFGMRGKTFDAQVYNQLPEYIRKQLEVIETETRYVAGNYTPGPDGGYTSRTAVEVPVRWKIPDDASQELLEALRKEGWASKEATESYKAAMEMAEWADNKSEDLLKQAAALLAEGKKATTEPKPTHTDPDKTNKEQQEYEQQKVALQEQYNKGVIDELSYKERIYSLEKNHFEQLIKANKATKEDAALFTAAKSSYEQLKIQTSYQKDLNDAQTAYNQGVLTQQEYLDKVASINKSIYETNLKNGTATEAIAQAYLAAKKAADEFGKTAKDKLQEELESIEVQLTDENLTVEAKIELINRANEIQQKLDQLSDHNDLTIKAIVEPKYITKGSIYDKRQSISNAKSMIDQTVEDYDNGLIDFKTAKSQIQDINKQLTDLGAKPYKVEIETQFAKDLSSVLDGAFEATGAISSIDGIVSSVETLNGAIEDGANAWEIFISTISVVESVLNAINTALEIGNMFTASSTTLKTANATASLAAGTAAETEAAAETAAIGQKTAAAIANKTLEASFLDLAAAQIFAAHAAIPFAGVGIAGGFITAMMSAMAAQHAAAQALQAFAGGGVVHGSTTMGDRVLVRANKGEMFLNTRQQANLFKALDQNRLNGGSELVGTVVKIKGSDLYLSFSNYDKTKSKIGKKLFS